MNIERPSYYTKGKIEVWDAAIDWDLPTCLATALKYIVRAGYKEGNSKEQDFLKAICYIEREERRVREYPVRISSHGAHKISLYEVLADWNLSSYREKCVSCIYHMNIIKQRKDKLLSIKLLKLYIKMAIDTDE